MILERRWSYGDVENNQVYYHPQLTHYAHQAFEEFFFRRTGLHYADLSSTAPRSEEARRQHVPPIPRMTFPVGWLHQWMRKRMHAGDLFRVWIDTVDVAEDRIGVRAWVAAESSEIAAVVIWLRWARDLETDQVIDIPAWFPRAALADPTIVPGVVEVHPQAPSGRPADGEFADYAKSDVEAVSGDDAVAALRAQLGTTLALLSPVAEEVAATRTYAPGKWTLKQIVGHLADDERIFTDRALRVARGDETPQPGFDEKSYVEHAGFERRSFADLLAEYRAVREATIRLFSTFTGEAWLRRGTVNGYAASTRGLAFHIAGHELHHLRIVREKYLP